MGVSIDCPVCLSRNYFRVEGATRELSCEDCGFPLSVGAYVQPEGLTRCLFCACTNFFLEAPLRLPFLERDSICYVCGARYKKTVVGAPDAKYDPVNAEIAQQSTCAQAFRKRAEQYAADTE